MLRILLAVLLTLSAERAGAVDSDLDGLPDGADNCVFESNAGQTDSGGLNTLVANGRGDACECGDASDDGPVTSADSAALRNFLADPSGAPLSAGGADKCTVHGDRPEPCSVLDVVILARALEPAPLAPGVAQACSPALCATCESANSPSVGGCQLLPATDAWNQDVSGLPVHAYSATYISTLESFQSVDFLRLDLGTIEPEYGIPYTAVPPGQALVPITFGTDGEDYSDVSDPGPFPIPLDVAISGGSPSAPDPTSGDRNVLVVRQGTCDLYELFNTVRTGMPVSGFMVSSSATWNLLSPVPRPEGWGSAQASGLQILPGLVRADEVTRGRIDHALGVTFQRAAHAYVAPARNFGPINNTNESYLPYGARLRLKATFSEAGYGAESLVLIRALKRYGLIFRDQGTSGFIAGMSDPSLAPAIAELNTGAERIPFSELEVVDTGDVAVCGWSPPTHCY